MYKRFTLLLASTVLAAATSLPVHAGQDCRFTQGYWQNRAENAADGTTRIWNTFRGRMFFRANSTYEDVLRTPVRGSAYYNLAHQYIAAQMNIVNGAIPAVEVNNAFRAATRMLATYTPVQIDALRKSDPLVRAMISHAGILDQWNNGALGTGQCATSSGGGGW